MSAGGGAPQHALSPVAERQTERAVVGRQWSVMGRHVPGQAPAAGDEDEGFGAGTVLGPRRRADRAASSESSDRSVTRPSVGRRGAHAAGPGASPHGPHAPVVLPAGSRGVQGSQLRAGVSS